MYKTGYVSNFWEDKAIKQKKQNNNNNTQFSQQNTEP